MKIDAIIPARGGSKGLYKKHTVLLGGKPLIEYTIEAAHNASSIRNIYLTTDDSELIERYKKDKRVKLIKRPRYLATDAASLKDVLKHVLRFIGRDKIPDLLAVLLPTAPFRTSKHIDEAVKLASSIPAFSSVASVTRLKSSPVGGILLSKDGRIGPLLKGSYRWYRRQDQPCVYRLNGAIWLIPVKRLHAINNLLLSNHTYAFEMDETSSVDIDTQSDIVVAEAILSFNKLRLSWNERGRYNVQRFYVHDDLKMGILRNSFDTAAYERHFGRYKFFLKYIKPHDSVLDIACGSGYGSQILASKARLVCGVDSDAVTIKYAKRHHGSMNVQFGVSAIEDFNTRKRYDKVISVETIEHLADPEAFLAKAKDWLKPQGQLLLTCPLSQDDSQQTENPFHISKISYERLGIMMRRYFKKVDFFNLSGGNIFLADTLNNRVTYIAARGSFI